MLQLLSVFSSHALFQQNSTLTLRGRSDAASVSVRLYAGERLLAEQSAPVTDGAFAAPIRTPAASLSPHRIVVSAGAEERVLEDVLFGELWLASGQSNMEFPTNMMPDAVRFVTEMADKPVRFYAQGFPEGRNAAVFPRKPSDAVSGEWRPVRDVSRVLGMSAVGTAFLRELTHYFRDRIPVGILNVSWGGTPIRGWIPEEAFRADAALWEKELSFGTVPEEKEWNTRGANNYQQIFVLYNSRIAPLRGVQVRGVIWYQGENDCGAEWTRRVYAQYLRCYQRFYAEHFGVDPSNFMMISSLLYPWAYGGSGDVSLGLLNQAFIDTALEAPHKFAFAPIADLPPLWTYHRGNHPIHPANKYEVGYRLALLAETNAYDRGSQRTPATLAACEREGSRLILRFRHASSGLRIDGPQVRGLYVAGADDLYLSAQCEILSPDTMAVWHPFLRDPKNAAYGWSSMEEGINLWAGEFPLAPFATDPSHPFRIEAKPWLDLHRQSLWCDASRDGVLNFFYYPVWQPYGTSEICLDRAFTRGDVSLRIADDENETCGAVVRARRYNRLDLTNYAALRVDLYNTDGLSAALRLTIDGKSDVTLPFAPITEVSDGWQTFEARFDGLPEGEIQKMTFLFTHAGKRYHFVNLERPVLIPHS